MIHGENMKFSKGILITAILISLTTACGSPKLVVPKIEYKTYAEVKAAEPSCVPQIDAMERAFIDGAGIDQESACIENAKCYSDVKRYWENYYKILDAKLYILNHSDDK